MLLPLKLYPLLSISEQFVIYTLFHLILQDVFFIFVLPIIFSFKNFTEGSSEKIPLVYVWLGCVFMNQSTKTCMSVNIPLASV